MTFQYRHSKSESIKYSRERKGDRQTDRQRQTETDPVEVLQEGLAIITFIITKGTDKLSMRLLFFLRLCCCCFCGVLLLLLFSLGFVLLLFWFGWFLFLFIQTNTHFRLTWWALNRIQTCVKHFSINVSFLAVVETSMRTAKFVQILPSFACRLWTLGSQTFWILCHLRFLICHGKLQNKNAKVKTKRIVGG